MPTLIVLAVTACCCCHPGKSGPPSGSHSASGPSGLGSEAQDPDVSPLLENVQVRLTQRARGSGDGNGILGVAALEEEVNCLKG